MTLNKANLKIIRADIDAALAAVEKKHGGKFSLGNIRYSTNDFRCKLEFVSTSDASGNAVNPDEINFKRDAFLVGVSKDAFGKSFTSRGKKYTITGINTRAHKFPIQGVNTRGDRYKFPVSALPTSLQA